ncbi:MAG: hypothetical protein Q9157_006666 [Trypethelium eluteriae]
MAYLSVPRFLSRRVAMRSIAMPARLTFSTPPSLHDRKVIEVVSYDHENRRRERLTVKDSDNIKAPSRDAVPTDLQVRYTACRWFPPNIAELHTRGEDRGGHWVSQKRLAKEPRTDQKSQRCSWLGV